MRNKFLLYLPAALTNDSAVGGQVTAAKGILHFFECHNYSYDLVDSAQATGKGWFVKRFLIFYGVFKLFMYALLKRYDSSLYFYSTVVGLLLRFFPATLIRLKSGHATIFFRNSNVLNAKKHEVLLLRLLLWPYGTIFVQGARLRQYFIELNFDSSKVVIVPNWMPPWFQLQPDDERKFPVMPLRFVFTGSLCKSKGVFDLIEAVANIQEQHEFSITLIGDGEALQQCKELCTLKSIKNIEFLAAMPHEFLMQKLKEFSILILPSHSEGFPNSVLEAMSSGLPVIVTDVGEVSDTVVDKYNGCLIPAKSIASIECAIRMYLNNPSLIAEHSQKALITVRKRHNWEKNCQIVCDRMLGRYNPAGL